MNSNLKYTVTLTVTFTYYPKELKIIYRTKATSCFPKQAASKIMG